MWEFSSFLKNEIGNEITWISIYEKDECGKGSGWFKD